MGLGQLLTRALKYVVTNTNSGAVGEYTVITDSGGLAPTWANAGYRGAMGIPGVSRAANLLADLIAALPWELWEEQDDGSSVKLPSLLLEQPCPPETRVTSMSSLVFDYLFHGNAVGVWAAPDDDGYPTALVPVPAQRVGVRRTDEGEAIPRGQIIYTIGNQEFMPWELLHVKGPCEPSALRGLGVLENHFETLELSRELAKQAKASSGGGIPTGVLRSTNPDAKTQSLKDLKRGWMEAQATRTVAVLNATTEFQALAWNPTEAQLIEARQFSLHELALIFNIDPSWLGVNTKSKVYSNLETEALNLSKFSINGMLARFEQAFSLVTPPRQSVKVSLDELHRPDTLTRYQALNLGIAGGWLLPSEARVKEKLRPVAGIDDRPRPTVPALPTGTGRNDDE